MLLERAPVIVGGCAHCGGAVNSYVDRWGAVASCINCGREVNPPEPLARLYSRREKTAGTVNLVALRELWPQYDLVQYQIRALRPPWHIRPTGGDPTACGRHPAGKRLSVRDSTRLQPTCLHCIRIAQSMLR